MQESSVGSHPVNREEARLVTSTNNQVVELASICEKFHKICARRCPIVRHRRKQGKQVKIIIWQSCVEEIKSQVMNYKCVPFKHWIS